MADWLGTRITVPKKALDLREVREKMEAMEECYDDDDGLTVTGMDLAPWGCFDELEELLRRFRIAYDRSNEAKYDCEAYLVQYRPEPDQPSEADDEWEVHITQSGAPLIAFSDLVQLAEERGGTLTIQDIRHNIGPTSETVAEWSQRHAAYLAEIARGLGAATAPTPTALKVGEKS